MVSRRERDEFDRFLDRLVDRLPEQLHELLAEVPLIVDDEPSVELLESLGMGFASDHPGDDSPTPAGAADLCGLHDGLSLTERSVEDGPQLPGQMMLFRGPIMRLAEYGGWGGHGLHGARPTPTARRELSRQIHITLLHEIGHHFGLDEDDLEALGYG